MHDEHEREQEGAGRRRVRKRRPPFAAVVQGESRTARAIHYLTCIVIAVATVAFVLYLAWLASAPPWLLGIIGGGFAVLFGAYLLLRGRCPHCGHLFAGRLIKVERRESMTLSPRGYYEHSVDRIEHFRCRFCHQEFEW
jgi:hypothetical protein